MYTLQLHKIIYIYKISMNKLNKTVQIYMKKTLSSCERQRRQIEIIIIILLIREAQYHRDINST